MKQSYRISEPAALPSRAMRLIDTHTHLYQPVFDNDRDAAMARCAEAGVEMLLLPNIDRESIPRVQEVMTRWPDRCRGMMGLHPCHVKEDFQEELDVIGAELRQGLSSGERPYVAVGEIGFDLYWDKSTLPLQQDAFRQQVEWANALDLPIVIHVREAFDALFEALDEVYTPGLRGVVHCFTGGRSEAERILDFEGFYLGIGGVATYKNGGLDKVLPHVPHDRVIVETDSPYLAPAPYRGKRNESAYTAVVAQRLADLWQIPMANCAAITTENAERLFRLQLPPESQLSS